MVIYFELITNSNEISNSCRFNLKLQSDLRIISNWITNVIDNADLWPEFILFFALRWRLYECQIPMGNFLFIIVNRSTPSLVSPWNILVLVPMVVVLRCWIVCEDSAHDVLYSCVCCSSIYYTRTWYLGSIVYNNHVGFYYLTGGATGRLHFILMGGLQSLLALPTLHHTSYTYTQQRYVSVYLFLLVLIFVFVDAQGEALSIGVERAITSTSTNSCQRRWYEIYWIDSQDLHRTSRFLYAGSQAPWRIASCNFTKYSS